MSLQTTLKHRVIVKGIGIHTGSVVTCVLHPAPANSGICFVRSDVKGLPKIRANVSQISRTDLSTTLSADNNSVGTVEHLMAAIVGMGVDNLVIEVSGPELPILDGSSLEFALAIEDAGLRTLDSPRKTIVLKKPVSVQVGDKIVSAIPANHLSISGSIDFQHAIIGKQNFSFHLNKQSFLTELAGARTFGFLKEVEYLRKRGLARGGSLDNAIVLDETKVLNPEGLRFSDEFIRHKILDALGDFALIGFELKANITVLKAGHEIHALFIKKILSEASQFEIVQESTPQPEQNFASDLELALTQAV